MNFKITTEAVEEKNGTLFFWNHMFLMIVRGVHTIRILRIICHHDVPNFDFYRMGS